MTSKNHSVEYLHKCETERQELLRLHDTDGHSWPKIACMPKYQGIPVGTLWSFAHGERELSDEYKTRLGIPHDEPAPVCLVHGVVHCYDCETQQVKPKRTPKPRKWRSLWDIPTKELAWMLENRS